MEESELLDQLARLEEEESSLTQELDEKTKQLKLVTEKDEELYRKLRDNHRLGIDLWRLHMYRDNPATEKSGGTPLFPRYRQIQGGPKKLQHK